MNRPLTTLFMIQSFDGKISTGDVDELDVDKDFSRIAGVKEGLHQYYDLEKKTDRVSFNSGRVMAKVGVNSREWTKDHPDDVDFVVVDNKPHLDEKGVEYFARRSPSFYVITTNKKHPAFALQGKYESIKILFYDAKVDFADAFEKLATHYKVERMTIQTGGTLNSELLRSGLIDQLSIVVAPCLVGGTGTQSLIGGESLHSQADLLNVKAMKLVNCEMLENSYLHIQYEVIKNTEIGE